MPDRANTRVPQRDDGPSNQCSEKATPRACSLAVQGGQDAGCFDLSLGFHCTTPAASSSRTPPSRPRESPHSRKSASDLRGGQRPTPIATAGLLARRSLHDAAHNNAVGKHVVIIVAPFAGQARGRCALEDQIVLVHFLLSQRRLRRLH